MCLIVILEGIIPDSLVVDPHLVLKVLQSKPLRKSFKIEIQYDQLNIGQT